MSRPQSNGLVELVDERPGNDSKSWNCMDFWKFSAGEEDRPWDASHARFMAAKAGNCPYRDRCPRYARTMAKGINKRPIQLKIF